ncbi:MAG TPA: PIN domain-containing protein [Candidatus Wirthbacteria bacterium]|nr:PIN domain-containing protein [Candidatus Wirthbacteria bacterium]
MIYLDTHVVIWLADLELHKLSAKQKELLESESLYISPIVGLELQYLFEIGRLENPSDSILGKLKQQIGLSVYDADYAAVVQMATVLAWTRDPFDRLIVAQAKLDNTYLLTKDERVLANYARAVG